MAIIIKRLTIIVLLCIGGFGDAFGEDSSSQSKVYPGFYYVTNATPPDALLTLRAKPSFIPRYIITEMPNNTVLRVLQKRGDGWWYVRVVDSGIDGWARSGTSEEAWIVCCTSRSASHQSDQPRNSELDRSDSSRPREHAEQQNRASQELPPNNVTIENAQALNKRIGDLAAQIETLTKVVGEQSELRKNASIGLRGSVEQTIAALNKRIEELKSEYNEKDKTFSTYLTSIKPNDREFYLTARRASESYPKIPYYIPGTKEIGEFWIEPTVTDKGELSFGFKFVDTEASIEKVRGKIDMSRPEIEDVQKALLKLHEWSEKAHRENVRSYEKRVTCFPVKECPPDGERIDGKTSTEIRFIVYENGSTAGRIQRNKGLFVEGYNVSIDSALMLQAYLNHVIKAANTEFTSGRRSKKELDEMFK
jgi:hypothetical protein